MPQNISTQIKPEWPQNMEKIFQEIEIFFKKEFNNNIDITYQVISEAYKGEKDIEKYYPHDLAIELNTKKKGLFKKNTHNIFMIYLVRDSEMKKNVSGGSLGGLVVYNAASQFEFWLDNDAIADKNPYGIIGSCS